MAVPGYPTPTHYSPHFTRRELDCRCGCKTPARVEINLAELAEELEAVRKIDGGEPMHVNCAYRCPKHNQEVGGVNDSQHIVGKAVDATKKNRTPRQLAAAFARVPAFANGGIGVYKGFVHGDIRGYKARW